jgi:hypothetical protein
MYRHGIVHELRDSMESNIRTTAPELDIAYTSQASALPIVASMISLPSQLNVQPMISNQQQYALLIKRMYEVGMISFTTTPSASTACSQCQSQTAHNESS